MIFPKDAIFKISFNFEPFNLFILGLLDLLKPVYVEWVSRIYLFVNSDKYKGEYDIFYTKLFCNKCIPNVSYYNYVMQTWLINLELPVNDCKRM